VSLNILLGCSDAEKRVENSPTQRMDKDTAAITWRAVHTTDTFLSAGEPDSMCESLLSLLLDCFSSEVERSMMATVSDDAPKPVLRTRNCFALTRPSIGYGSIKEK
jgi:hypothetical protein